MREMALNHILPKFINNTTYDSDSILCIIQIAMASSQIETNKIPLTVISTLQDIPTKLGYYYTPAQLKQDLRNGIFLMGEKEFKRAEYGVVRLRLNFFVTAKQFLTTAIHEYIHAVQCSEMGEEDTMIVQAKERAAYEQAEKLVEEACREDWVVEAIANLDRELSNPEALL